MAFYQTALLLLSYPAVFPECCRGLLVLITALFRFAFSGVVVYAFPLGILFALRRNPSFKVRILLLLLSALVIIFGIIVLIWNYTVLSNLVFDFFYFLLLSFSIAGIVGCKTLRRDLKKRILLILLPASSVYFCWSILGDILPVVRRHPEGDILFTFFTGAFYLMYEIRFSGQNSRGRNRKREELLGAAGISGNEARYIAMLEKGMSNNEISTQLGIDVKDVDSYIFTIYKKLQVNNRYELFKKLNGG